MKFDPNASVLDRMAYNYAVTVAKSEQPVKAEFRVTKPGYEIETNQLPSNILKLIKPMIIAKAKIRARHSETWEEGLPFKTGSRSGELRPDKLTDHHAVAVDHPKFKMTATWLGGVLNQAHVWTPERGRFTIDAAMELSSIIKGAMK